MGLAIGIAANAQELLKPAPVGTNPPPTAAVVAPPAAPVVPAAPVPVAQPPPVVVSSPPGVAAGIPAVPPQGTVAPLPTTVEAKPAAVVSGATNPVAPVVAPVPVAPSTNAVAASLEAPGGTNRALVRPPSTNSPIAVKTPEGLRMNFRSAPLDQILNFLSEAAGFIVTLETDVRGRFDVWSSKALSKEEAVDLLNVALSRNGYAAIANGNRLSIMSKDEAKRRNIPVKTGNKAEEIPANEQIVTQIIPMKSISAMQLLKDLQPILPPMASITANEGGNSIVITDTQSSIKRLVEIISALDTSVAGASIKVFPLTYADAKSLATIIKELFASDSSGRGGSGDPRAMFGRMGQMASRFGGMPGMSGSDPRGGRTVTTVVATADERSNAVIVNAPEHVMPVVEELIKTVDTSVEDETEVKVFPLTYSDPAEMAELLEELFPDETQSASTSGRSGGGRTSMFRQPTRTTSGAAGERAKKIGRVIAVPDQRTASVIVSASKTMMPQIADMIQQLDANPAKKQKVFVYTLENADVDQVSTMLNDMFQSQNSRNTRSRSSTQNNALLNRSTQNQRNVGSANSSTSRNTSRSR